MIWKQIRLFFTPSIYQAALALDQNTGVIGMYNGKVWRNRDAMKVLAESD